MKLFYAFLTFILLLSCESDSRANSRAYVEGKITGTNLDYGKITVKLISDDTNVAETVPTLAGQFTLSGPLISDSFALVLNRKIATFSSSKAGCRISPDSLQIIVPEGISYIIFNEIKLK